MKISNFCILILILMFSLPLVIGVEFTNKLNFNISLSEKYKNRVSFTIDNSIYSDKQVQLDYYGLEPVKPFGVILPGSLKINSNKGEFEIKIIPSYEITSLLHVTYTDENGTVHEVVIPGETYSEKEKLEIKKTSEEPLSISKDNPLNLTFSMVLVGFIHEYDFNTYAIEYSFGVPEAHFNSPTNYKNTLSGRVEIPFGFINHSKDEALFIPYILDCSSNIDTLNYSFDQTDKNSIILIDAPEHKEDFYLNFLFALRDSSKPPIKIMVEDVLDSTKNNRVVSEIKICNEDYGDILRYDFIRDSINEELKGIKFLREGGRTLEEGKCTPKEKITFEKYSKKIFNLYPFDNQIYNGQRNFSSLLTIEEGFEADFEIVHIFTLVTREQFELVDTEINYTYNSVESISDLDIPVYQKELINQCKGHVQLSFDTPFLDETAFEPPPSSEGGIYIYKEPQNFFIYSPFREGYYTYNFHVKRSQFETVAPFFLLIVILIIGSFYIMLPEEYTKKIFVYTDNDKIFWTILGLPQVIYQLYFKASFNDYVSPNSITLWLTLIIYLFLILFYFIKKKKSKF